MTRLIDYMCRYHRRWTVTNRMWRDTFICDEGCRTVEGITLLPHLDSARQLAIHEAGHAVVYLALGEELVSAHADSNSLDPHQPAGGVRTVNTNVDGRGVLAGTAAVARWADPITDADLVDIANGARHDFCNVWRAGVDVDVAALLLRGAAELVAEHWAAIERVADALLAAGRLSGDELAAIARVGVCS